MYQLNSKDIKLFSKLYAGVIYDALVFDLNYKKPFLLDSCIKKVSGKKLFPPRPSMNISKFKKI